FIVILLSLLQPSCFLRQLHSFPTRRSSDLVARKNSCSSSMVFCAVMSRKSTTHSWVLGIRAIRISSQRPSLSLCLIGSPWHTGKDRKSTRLNSSHVSISYAVFCLKANMLAL